MARNNGTVAHRKPCGADLHQLKLERLGQIEEIIQAGGLDNAGLLERIAVNGGCAGEGTGMRSGRGCAMRRNAGFQRDDRLL